MNISIVVDSSDSGRRLDALVHDQYKDLSRSRASALIRSGDIRVDGIQKRPGYKVKTGETISGESPDISHEPIVPEPQAMALDILYEDDQLLVVMKPAGLVVHPGAGNVDATLVNGLLHHYPHMASACEDPLRPGIVHRLDKDTSGLMVVAKTPSAFAFLKDEFFHHRVEKIYQALVWGSHLDDEGRVDLPIGRHPVKRKQMAVDSSGGRPALTHWTVLNRYKNACHVRVRLHTGRTHQIRVHFHAMGHPLLGDRVYQFKRFRKQGGAVPRQMLHAGELGFHHPVTHEFLSFSSEPPLDFMTTLSKLQPQ